MKKIIFLFLFSLVLSAVGICQSFTYTATNSGGTFTNTAADTMYFSVPKDYLYHGIQVVITRATGTMAGTAVLYGTIDGTNYVTTGDTLTTTNAAKNSAIWTKTNPVYNKYRIIRSGATTVTGSSAAKFSGRKPNT